MHGKAPVIVAALEALELAFRQTPAGLDTDRFGTFTRDVARAGDQMEAARAKAQAALDLWPWAQVAIASEGAFGPHPALPIVPGGHEIVLMRDRDGRELIGADRTFDTNYAHQQVSAPDDARHFADLCGFPAHGLVLMTPGGAQPITKDIADWAAFDRAVAAAIAEHGAVWIETDMRAHRNPRRMASIGRAAANLAERWAARCPVCAHPGWVPQLGPGRPCGWCGAPTQSAWRQLYQCLGCGHAVEGVLEPDRRADPASCDQCNP
ncbi:DUF6671 family protein [Sphingomonas sp.]|uniref:DUF6671 family protein n=1 Tax=Sphingomonas sp. TaxID=28214 RepID=UPI001DC0B720|nr:DUF6671 family protein [Sphingomonas sp.]MBX9796028.1 hypothetical protein [Sphingomonas sp.]